ncbi:glycosyltransferase family 4 protein, partial [Candidatus Nomurabacteria bacterium]|nr:glycosyltransferase family 4 protein [Candidatus Nomurabacteria bacterium]
KKLLERLDGAGHIIIKGFIDKIEELYNIADIYFFPVKGLSKNYFPKTYNEVGVIDTPLSVLEAIAVGIPIVTTEIDSLTNILDKNTLENLVVWDGSNNLVALFNKMIKLNIHPYGKSAMKFSSQTVSSELNYIYNSLVA